LTPADPVTARIDPDDGKSYYAVWDVMRLSPARYAEWVYAPRTQKVDEVRILRSKVWNRRLNGWPVWLPHAIWWPVALWLALPLEGARLAWMALGFLLLWPLLEVGFHRFLFHMPVRSRLAQRLHVTMHGSHHLAPGDPGRLTSHPLLVTGYSSVLYALASALGAGAPDALVAGLLVGYLRCDATHAAIHLVSHARLRRVPLVGRFLAGCKRNHMAHHFADPHRHFAISFYRPGARRAVRACRTPSPSPRGG
jgi:hypothetical protein